MENNEKLEEIAMMIIANSGEARSESFNALSEAEKGNFDEADRLLAKADDDLRIAHNSHSELLKLDCSGEIETMSVLLAHAQDHLMTSSLAKDLIKEMIVLYKRIG